MSTTQEHRRPDVGMSRRPADDSPRPADTHTARDEHAWSVLASPPGWLADVLHIEACDLEPVRDPAAPVEPGAPVVGWRYCVGCDASDPLVIDDDGVHALAYENRESARVVWHESEGRWVPRAKQRAPRKTFAMLAVLEDAKAAVREADDDGLLLDFEHMQELERVWEARSAPGEPTPEATQAHASALATPTCRICRCTGDKPCEGDTDWVTADLCQTCAPLGVCEVCPRPATQRVGRLRLCGVLDVEHSLAVDEDRRAELAGQNDGAPF